MFLVARGVCVGGMDQLETQNSVQFMVQRGLGRVCFVVQRGLGRVLSWGGPLEAPFFLSHVPSNSDISEKKCLRQLQEAIFLFRNSDLSKLDLLSQCWVGIRSGGPQGAPGGVFKNFGRPRGAPLRPHQKYMGPWGGSLGSLGRRGGALSNFQIVKKPLVFIVF